MMANVIVVVAMMIQVRFFLNSSVFNLLGMKKRKNSWLSTTAMMM